MADAFHGQGTYSHSSGISYEGLWVNGYPAVMADRLVIKVESPLQITQGSAFSLVVESHNEDGELVEGQWLLVVKAALGNVSGPFVLAASGKMSNWM